MKKQPKNKLKNYLQKHAFLSDTIKLENDISTVTEKLITPLSAPRTDKLKLTAQGLPLLQHVPLARRTATEAAKVLPQAATAAAALAAPAPFTAAAKKIAAVTESISRAETARFFNALIRHEHDDIRAFCEKHELNEALLRSLSWRIIDRLIPAEWKDTAFWETEAHWERNYCPVCGRRAVLAQLKKEREGRARYLVCGGCHTVWRYARVGCTYCDNTDLEKMRILEPAGEPDMRLDVCDVCNAYIKTYVNEGDEEIFLSDWATLHLDLLGEEKGLRKNGSTLTE